MSIFSYLKYEEFIESKLKEQRGTYRYKTQLAEAAGWQPSFFSQVLAGKTILMPHHAVGLAQFWALTESETEYFVELVHFARAGGADHRRYIERRLKKLRVENENLSLRYKKETFSTDFGKAAVYYSSWHYTAVHMLLTVPAFRTSEKISKRLGISVEAVQAALRVLENLGLATKQGVQWSATNHNIHIEKSSPLHQLNHHHWRQQSILRSVDQRQEDLLYTALYSLSVSDWLRIRALCLKFIDESRGIVQASPAEELICFTMDVFKV